MDLGSLGKNNKSQDYLWLHLKDLPYFRALLRAVEARVYRDFALPAPTLDLGCGDGHFATIAFNRQIDVGVDPWTRLVQKAAKLGGYRYVIQGNGEHLPFSDDYFSSAISNSVLEHIPDLDAVIIELARVMRPGAPFLFCVPNHNFLLNLSIAFFLNKLGLQRLADSYRNLFNRISRHHHCDSPDVWRTRLERYGFWVEQWWHYFSPRALHALEWGHYFGLPSLIFHWLFGRWILVPTRWNLSLTKLFIQHFYDENPVQPEGSYTFYITRRMVE